MSPSQITATALAREKYKLATNTFTEKGFTPEHRQQLESILGDLEEQIVNDVAADRGVSAESVRTAIGKGILGGEEALEGKLLDSMAFRDEVVKNVCRIGWL